MNNLPKVVTCKRNGRESNARPFASRANTLAITPPGQHRQCCTDKINVGPKPLASTPPGMPGTHPPIFWLGGRQREYLPQYYYVFSEI